LISRFESKRGCSQSMGELRRKSGVWNFPTAAFARAEQPKLARETSQFVNAMPPEQTERKYFVVQARKPRDKQQMKRPRGST